MSLGMRRSQLSDWLMSRGPADSCSYDEQVDIVIHRFDTGARVCRCGKLAVSEPLAPITGRSRRRNML